MEDEEPGGAVEKLMQTQPELWSHKNDSFSTVFERNGQVLFLMVNIEGFDAAITYAAR